MYKTAEAITQCKFEATDPASDEVVLYKILQVKSCALCSADIIHYESNPPRPLSQPALRRVN